MAKTWLFMFVLKIFFPLPMQSAEAEKVLRLYNCCKTYMSRALNQPSAKECQLPHFHLWKGFRNIYRRLSILNFLEQDKVFIINFMLVPLLVNLVARRALGAVDRCNRRRRGGKRRRSLRRIRPPLERSRKSAAPDPRRRRRNRRVGTSDPVMLFQDLPKENSRK